MVLLHQELQIIRPRASPAIPRCREGEAPDQDSKGEYDMAVGKILIVNDDAGMRFVLSEALTKQGYQCTEADGQQVLARMQEERQDVVILDLKMPRMGGMEMLSKIKAMDPDTVVIIVTAFGSREMAYEALNAGAYDYFSKPLDINEVRTVVGRATERVLLVRTLHQLQKNREAAFGLDRFLGQSNTVLRLREKLQKLAQSDSTVLITGESGTGKELAAQIIHFQSRRNMGPFIAVNCAAIPEALLEAELFGHEKGAFTGAYHQRAGKFEAGSGGTVFLDEIGDMPPAMQTKILRVLQERTVERVGGVKPFPVDMRLIAATNRDLAAAVKNGAFREDLFYRLNVVPVHIEPLRDRPEDIPVLAEFFLRQCKDNAGGLKRLSPGAQAALKEYHWPGNVRELDNIMQRAALLSDREEISEEEMRSILGAHDTDSHGRFVVPQLFIDPEKSKCFTLSDAVGKVIEQVEKKIIQQALDAMGGKRQETADLLKISRKSLHNKMKRYNMD
jgi:DNA-binding NtrC family response regulator